MDGHKATSNERVSSEEADKCESADESARLHSRSLSRAFAAPLPSRLSLLQLCFLTRVAFFADSHGLRLDGGEVGALGRLGGLGRILLALRCRLATVAATHRVQGKKEEERRGLRGVAEGADYERRKSRREARREARAPVRTSLPPRSLFTAARLLQFNSFHSLTPLNSSLHS